MTPGARREGLARGDCVCAVHAREDGLSAILVRRFGAFGVVFIAKGVVLGSKGRILLRLPALWGVAIVVLRCLSVIFGVGGAFSPCGED